VTFTHQPSAHSHAAGQVRDFVNRFLPAYEAYLPGLYSHGPTTSTPTTPLLEILVDADRNVQR
jgi:D-glycerate 3-kinase